MDYVIIGNGVAGTSAAAAIRKFDKHNKLTIVSEEEYPFYSRVRLPQFLSDDVDEKRLILKDATWHEENGISLFLNTVVVGANKGRREITTSTGSVIKYDRLLLATGARSFVPAIPGSEKKGVFTLRTLRDALEIKGYQGKGGKKVLLIGGGVLGLEAATGLAKAGNYISVLEFFPRLLPRQMDPEGAELLKASFEKRGFNFHLGLQSERILGEESVSGVLLNNGARVEADMVLISAGVRPDTALAQKLELETTKGVVVDDRMLTSSEEIYAAGDAAEHRGICYGIWPAAEKQGEIAGINMAGGNALYGGTIISNTLKVAGVDLVAAGDIDADGEKESVVIKDVDNFIYKKIVIDQNVITGTILYGDTKDRKAILRAIEDRTDIGGMRQRLRKWDLEGLTAPH